MRNPAAAFALLTALLVSLPLSAEEVEAQLSDPIAKASGFVLGGLLPKAIDEAVQNPFDKRPSDVSNSTGTPFQATFETTSPSHPFVVMTLLVSEREFVMKTIDRIFGWAESGKTPPDMKLESDFPQGFDCIADVGNRLISCRFGSAGVQFSAVSINEDNGIDYSEVKAIFLTLPTATYASIFGQ